MTTTVLCIGSLIVGASGGGLAVYLRMQRNVTSTELVDGLTDTDREEVARDFAVHVHSVQRKISEFADALADGDVELRNRLRHFEKGGDRP